MNITKTEWIQLDQDERGIESCPMDQSTALQVLGILGNCVHYRCISCGWFFNKVWDKKTLENISTNHS